MGNRQIRLAVDFVAEKQQIDVESARPPAFRATSAEKFLDGKSLSQQFGR
jgi:hypothetical protein